MSTHVSDKELTAGAIAARISGEITGDPGRRVCGVAGLIEAGPDDLTYLASPRYVSFMEQTRAAVVIVSADWRGQSPAILIRVANPEAAFMQVAAMFMPPPIRFPPGVHATAVIAADARVGRNVTIGPYCVIESGAVIGDDVVLVAHVYIGHSATVGAACLIYPFVTVREYVRVGVRTILHGGVVLGSDGFGYDNVKGKWQKIPQQGTVEVGDDAEIGVNCAVDRARFGVTRIGNGVKIDNLDQIAHNVHIGDDSIMAGLIGIAGSTHLGRRVRVGGQSGLTGHIQVGDDAVIGAQSGVTNNVAPATVVFGAPAAPYEKAITIQSLIKRLPELKARIMELEKQVNELRAAAQGKPSA